MIWLALVLSLAPPVTLSVDACTKISQPEVRRVLELELLSSRAAITGVTAAVACDGPAIAFSVDDPITGRALTRTVDLSRAAPNARARLLALAIVEVVEASWSEQLFSPPPAPEVHKVVPPPAPVALAPAPRPKFGLTAHAASRALLTSPLWQWGGGLRFVHTPFRFLGWAAEIAAEHGTFSTTLGSVFITSGDGLLELLGQLVLGPVAFHLSAGTRVGVVHARGVPSVPLVRAREVIGPWAGVLGALSASAGAGMWFLTARAEGGQILLGVPSRVANVNTGMVGPWLGLSLGLGVRL